MSARTRFVAIVGESSCADAASAKYLASKNVPVVGGWACSPTWLNYKNMFLSLAGPNEPDCPIWSSDAAKARGIKKIAFIAQDFPEAVNDAVCRSSAAKHIGLTMVGPIIKVSPTAVDYRPAVQQAISAGADAIYFSTGADGQVKGIQAGEQLGFKGTYIATQFGSSLLTGLASAGLTSKLSGRVISAAFSLLTSDPSSYSAELGKALDGITKYQPQYKDDVTALSGWAAGKLFADALTAVGPDPAKIIGWIAKQSHYTFGGLQGPMNYTTRFQPNQCVTAIQWKNGKVTRDSSAVAGARLQLRPAHHVRRQEGSCTRTKSVITQRGGVRTVHPSTLAPPTDTEPNRNRVRSNPADLDDRYRDGLHPRGLRPRRHLPGHRRLQPRVRVPGGVLGVPVLAVRRPERVRPEPRTRRAPRRLCLQPA